MSSDKSTYSRAVPFFPILALVALLAIQATAQPVVEQGLQGNAFAGVVPAPNGRLYGAVYQQGQVNQGTLYSVDPLLLSPPVVHVTFTGPNGAIPYDELTYDPGSSKFYGATSLGGATGLGTIFSFDPATNVLVTLKGDFGSSIYEPRGPFVVSGGFIYGILGRPFGGVFRMATDGSGFTILHNFADFSTLPQAVTLGADGWLYGVTLFGGIVCNPFIPDQTCGTLFRLRPVLPGDTNVQFQTIYQMQADRFDAGPQRTVVYGSDGLIYFNNHIRIFRLDPNNPTATFQRIWNEPGGSISMSIIEGADNRLYAASYSNNQSSGAGSVFSINRDGSDKQVLRLFSFTLGSRAYGPYGRLYRSTSGVIYGTTEYTIPSPTYGTVFAIGAGSNSPPVVSNVAATSPVTENGSTTLSGTIADPDPADTFTLTVDWGDSSPAQVFNYPAGTTAFSETHQYLDDNPSGTASDNYTIGLTLADNNGGTDTDSALVTLNNAPPVLSNITVNPATITAGQTISLSGSISDPGTLDTHEVTINWGDGTPDTVLNLSAGVNSFNTVHQYNATGTLNIAITATDDDTGSTTANATVNVLAQLPPVLSNVAVNSPIVENGTATLTGNISDPNALDTFVLAINWGDGSPIQMLNYPAGTTAFSETHQYLDDNPTGTPSDNYTIDLILSDNGGLTDTASAVVSVNNAAPVLSNIAANPGTVIIGGTTNIGGAIADVGTLDTHTITINWGDGTPATTINLAAGETAFNADHDYNAAGTFNITVTASDDDTDTANGGASVTVSPSQPGTGKIAFHSARDGNFEIYTMNPDGSNQTRLTNNTASDLWPAISPDGTRIVFTSTRAGNGDIWVMNSDGTGQTRLTSHPGLDGQPSFSPNGSRIVFFSDRNGNQEIYVMNADGSDQTRLTNSPRPDFEPVFSPDGSKIAFTSQRLGPGQVYIMNADGSNQVRLSSAMVDEYDPSFSPDGTRIAFVSFRPGPTNDIYIMNADGSNVTPLTNNPAGDISPSFSPDGNQIAFASNREGSLQIYIMNSDGSNQIPLTNTVPGNDYPSWGVLPSPTGGKIVFNSNRDGGNWEIYSMNANGSNPTRLTNNPATDYNPSLSPDGSRIVFSTNRHGDYEIYVMNSDGSGQTRLTNNAGGNYDPSFSPDGNQIVFVTARHGDLEIYAMNSDGTNQTRLTDNSAADGEPSFSPDGSRIVFQSNRDGNYEIYSMNPDGGNPTRLTFDTAGDGSPSFNPDGSRIVFSSSRDGVAQIYAMNPDGTNQTRLSTVFAFETLPIFSPDGSQIAFVSYRDNTGGGEIYVMNSDGTNQRRLTNNPATELFPSWGIAPATAPGRKIVFHSGRDGNAEIYTMNSNGTNQMRLTFNPAFDGEGSTSSDGSRIVFVSMRDGNSEIYVMNADGTNQTRLTNNPAEDGEPSFSPDGSRIVFTSLRDNGFGELYVMNADGTGQTRLTNNNVFDRHPTFSPDGRRIAFYSERSPAGIYMMNSNGRSNPTFVTNGYEPSFSPDGNRIAFTSADVHGFGVFIVNTNGTNRTRLTPNSSSNFDPSFSPDGQIAFESLRDGNFQIYLMNSDGSNQTRLTNNTAGDLSPSWGGLVLRAPTNLTATAVSPTQINLSWTDNSAGEDGFAIERCTGVNCTNFVRIATTGANVTAIASSGLIPQTFYRYRVKAFSTGGDSPYSNIARDRTPR
ncbi:MAG TPA: DUF5050 domain-containing protein [Pyrinomonadaceae bacterium]|nr:DUF5050 domain-containing protein [Pyrinomonadaceae bacterium]